MSAYHSDLIGLRIYVERYLLILRYFEISLSVQFHISVAAPEVRSVAQLDSEFSQTLVPSASVICAR